MIGAWGPPVTVPAANPVPRPALAVDARGDVALAWRDESADGRARAIRVAYLAAGARTATRHTLMARSQTAVQGLTAVLDRHGRLTVVWVARGSTSGALHGHITLLAARRTGRGRWSAPRAIARITPFAYAQPRLAVAPADDTVALTYNSGTRAAPGVALAWARPNRPFAAPQAVPSGRLGFLQEPSLGFDTRGRLRLAGVADCDDETNSRGVLFTAAGVRRRLRGPLTIAPAPVNHLRLTLAATGPTPGVASWLRTGCSTSEDLGGAPMAATVLDDTVSAPVALDAGSARDLTAVRGADGATDVGWTGFPAARPAGAIVTARVLPAVPPTAGPATVLPGDGWAPTAADWLGDQALTTALSEEEVGVRSTAAREADGTVLPSPLPAVAWPVTAGADDGRALAAAAPGTGSIRLSVWRPRG